MALKHVTIAIRAATPDEFESELETWKESATNDDMGPEPGESLEEYESGRSMFVWLDAEASHDETLAGETEVAVGQLSTMSVSSGMTETDIENELDRSGALPAALDRLVRRLAEDERSAPMRPSFDGEPVIWWMGT